MHCGQHQREGVNRAAMRYQQGSEGQWKTQVPGPTGFADGRRTTIVAPRWAPVLRRKRVDAFDASTSTGCAPTVKLRRCASILGMQATT